jgi:hypothetical protein
MQEVLLRKLIEKTYFGIGTEIDATHRALDLSGAALHAFEGTFTVLQVLERRQSKTLVLEVASTRDGSKIRIEPAQIVGIDGMTPERFAENYMIYPDGTDIKVVGKRRGRRPKNWNPETQRVEN